MIVRLALVALLVGSVPASAADLASTHQAVEVGPGKLHARAYRPLAKPSCTARHDGHPAGGRIPAAAPAQANADACMKQEAAREAAKKG